MQSGGDAVPWRNMERYSRLMLQRSIEDYLAYASAEAVTIFDRGILDTVAHFRIAHLDLPKEAKLQARQLRCNRKAFITPPWQQIYETDIERKQTFEESLLVYRTIKEVYTAYDYELIEIPQASASERADFILRSL